MDLNKNKIDIIKHLPIETDEHCWEIAVSGIGRLYLTPKDCDTTNDLSSFHPKQGKTLKDFSLVYISKGEGEYVSSDCPLKTITKGNVFITFPNQWHTYKPNPNTKWSEYWITFSGDYFERLLKHIVNKKDPIFHIGINEDITRLFSQILEYAIKQPTGFQTVISSLTLHLISLIYYINKNDNQYYESVNMQKVHEACIFMEENIYDKFTLEDIAKSMNMSYSNFRKVFKLYKGITPHQYIIKIKLRKVKELLNNTNMSIHDIATKLNFESADYFSCFFKNRTGVSPMSYRKKITPNNE